MEQEKRSQMTLSAIEQLLLTQQEEGPRLKTPWGTIRFSDFKSTFLIVGICALLSAFIYSTTYSLVYNLVTKTCDEITVRDIDKIKLKIDLELSRAQEALQTFSTAVFQNGHNIPSSEEEIYMQMESFLQSTPFISGIIAGFEDHVFPQYADNFGFGPLVRNSGGSLVRYQVGEIRDFRHVKEWYTECFVQKKARWTSPFFSEEGDIIIDYCIPLTDNTGEVIGVLACNLSIAHLRQVTEDIKPYPASIVMMMLEDLTFVTHPQKGYPMHKSLPVYFKERGIVEPNAALMEALRKGETGKFIDAPLGEDLFLYYDVIDKAGYRLLIESPSSDVYSSLHQISSVMKWLGLGGLLALMLTLAFMIVDNKKRERRSVERNMRILRQAAEIDGLTDIYNRVTGESLIKLHMNHKTPGVFAILDCDHFKHVNDSFGHSSGDKLLREIASSIRQCFADDVCMRLGGDEFAIYCLGQQTAEEFQARVDKFFSSIRAIRIEGMGDYEPSVSMGAAIYNGESDISFDRLYSSADSLLYESKNTNGCMLTI